MRLFLSRLNPRIYIATECGHWTRQTGRIKSEGRRMFITLAKENGQVDYCHGCLADMTTRCPRCLLPIFIGEAVMGFLPDPTSCVHLGCGENEMRWVGFWLPNEYDRGHVIKVAQSAWYQLMKLLPVQNHILLQDIYGIIKEHPFISNRRIIH